MIKLMIYKTLRMPILIGCLIALPACDKIDQFYKDPNLRMTFSCHGEKRIERSDGKVWNEPVSHSLTFSRVTQKKEKKDSQIKYKVHSYILDNAREDLTRHDFLDEGTLKKVQKTDFFHVQEQYGVFSIFLSESSDPDRKVGFSSLTSLKFNFITQALSIDVSTKMGGKFFQSETDRTRCQKVTDPDILKGASNMVSHTRRT